MSILDNDFGAFKYILSIPGISLADKNSSGYTILHILVERNLRKCLEYICTPSDIPEEGATHRIANQVYDILDFTTNFGLTAVHISINNGKNKLKLNLLRKKRHPRVSAFFT
jgi:hypothetical protein